MYKNLSPVALGVSGRQSELIELALTYGFRGMDVDVDDFMKRVELRGLDYTRRYLESARMLVGSCRLPVRWQGEESEFQQDLARLPQVAAAVASTGCAGCTTIVPAACDTTPYHELFELCRRRLAQVAEVLAGHELRLGLAFNATKGARDGKQFEFIHQAEKLLVLMQTIGSPNVGVSLDLWHWALGGGTVEHIRNLPVEKIVTVRAADLASGVSADEATEKDAVLPKVDGPSKTPTYLSALVAMGYNGAVTPYAHISRLLGETREKIVQAASNSMDDCWTAAGLGKPQLPEFLRRRMTDEEIAEEEGGPDDLLGEDLEEEASAT